MLIRFGSAIVQQFMCRHLWTTSMQSTNHILKPVKCKVCIVGSDAAFIHNQAGRWIVLGRWGGS